MTAPNFCLVIASNIEGVIASPKVQVIADPIHQLPMIYTSSMTLSGIR